MATIEHSAVTGTNENSTTSTTVTLSNYAHPGGWLVVFSRHSAGSSTGSCSFNSTNIDQAATASSNSTSGANAYCFAREMATHTGDIVVTYGASRGSRGIFALSISGIAGVRDTDTSAILSSSEQTATVVLDTVTDELCLQYASWRISDSNVTAYSTDQTQVLGDQSSPTRMDGSKKTATGASTTLSATLSAATDNYAVTIGVSLEDSAVAALNVNISPETTTAPGVRIYG